MEITKDNDKAVEYRDMGNLLYKRKMFIESLDIYNRSICWAQGGTSELAVAYANRSAVCYELGDFEFALANIALAKKANYPERLMPKLEARERLCHQRMADTERVEQLRQYFHLYPKVTLNVEVNPRIPFLAKGVHGEREPSGRPFVVADRDFKVGDVILDEKALLGCLNPKWRYQYCDYCTSHQIHVMIPCPHCVSVMYCDEECQAKGWSTVHRFECGVSQKLLQIDLSTGWLRMGAKVFLYALGLFKDDVEAMMKFWKTHPKEGNDSIRLDYVNYDPMKEFQTIYHLIKLMSNKVPQTFVVAIEYYEAYRQCPAIKSLFDNDAKLEFMRRAFLECFNYFWWSWNEDFHCHLLPVIAEFFTDKPYPESNLKALSLGGRAKLVVTRAIKKGSRLNVQQGEIVGIECEYTARCRKGIKALDLASIVQVQTTDMDMLTKLNALQQFLQKYSHLPTRCVVNNFMKHYQELLQKLRDSHMKDEMRVKISSKIALL